MTNIPSPYRVDFLNELGRKCELTACFERKTASNRDEKWNGDGARTFREIYAEGKSFGEENSKGNGVIKVIKKETFDRLVLTEYSSPAIMRAILYCRLHRIPFYIEHDGGFNKKDSFTKGLLKKVLLCGAEAHLTTCEEHKKYLLSIGIPEDKIFMYPFTSVRADDIASADNLLRTDKKTMREKLEIHEDKVVLSIGQFIHRKGFDILMQASTELDKNVGVYIVGGKPTEEYLALKNKLALDNVHFVGFKTKSELAEYYAAADLFVLPTREDIWGLVINEAMSFGLPCITTDRCIAGLELVENGKNGYIVPVDDSEEVAKKIKLILNDEKLCDDMGRESRRKIEGYTVEKMANRHLEIMKSI